MPLTTNVQNLAIRIATEIKTLRTLVNGNQPNLAALQTTAKTNLVEAINELVAAQGGSGSTIDDSGVSRVSVWSSAETDERIDSAVADLVSSAPGALDTLNELAAALGDDPNFATTIANQIAAATAQATEGTRGTVTLATPAEVLSGTDTQKVVTPAGLRSIVGNPEVDLVASFEAGLI